MVKSLITKRQKMTKTIEIPVDEIKRLSLYIEENPIMPFNPDHGAMMDMAIRRFMDNAFTATDIVKGWLKKVEDEV
jgi:hypothetical protein